jgi:chemotaxis signal transduction protein
VNRDVATLATHERLLTFEVAGSIYALPIACVVEVSEVGPLACIPLLPLHTAGVVNYHGDALPVLRRSALLGVDEAALPEPHHVLVLAARPTGGPRLGLPVDRIVGLVDGAPAAAGGADLVAEQRSIDGRVVFVLDPSRLVDSARTVIEHSLGRGG